MMSLFFTVEIGLFAGICTNVVHLALMWSRPKLKIEIIEVSVPLYVYNTVVRATDVLPEGRLFGAYWTNEIKNSIGHI